MHLGGCCSGGLGQFEVEDSLSWGDIFKQGVQDVENILIRPRTTTATYPGYTPPYVSPLPPPLPYPADDYGERLPAQGTNWIPFIALAGLALVIARR